MYNVTLRCVRDFASWIFSDVNTILSTVVTFLLLFVTVLTL
jgi:hypothetical protein